MAGGNEVNANESKMVVPLNTFVLISNFKLAYNMLRRPDGSFDRHLAEFLDRKVQANASPVNGVVSFDRILDRQTNLLARIYRPAPAPSYAELPHIAAIYELQKAPSADAFPVIIFFHGGSFAHSTSSSAIYDTLCRRFVTLCGGAVVISVDYRRSPEHRYPCAYDDGWTALKWASSQQWLHSGKDAKLRVFLAGDSSGGNIVHHVAVRAVESGIHVLGNILLNPLFGGNERTESELKLDGKYFVGLQDRDWYWRAFLPEGADRDHPACNPFGPNGAKLEGLPFPKTLLVVASLDLTQDWQLAYEEGLKKAGHEVRLLYREQAAKETASNISASAKAGMDKTKAVAQEKVDKMKTSDPVQKQMAEQKKTERMREAELEKRRTQQANAVQKEEAHHAAAGQRHIGFAGPTGGLATAAHPTGPTGGSTTAANLTGPRTVTNTTGPTGVTKAANPTDSRTATKPVEPDIIDPTL